MRFFAKQPVIVDTESRIVDGIAVRSMQEILERSSATDSFKQDVKSLVRGETTRFIHYPLSSPRIKVLRVILKFLDEFPLEPVEAMHLDAISGCATYEGTLRVEPGDRRFRFVWDCAWRARENKVTNRWGWLDQAEAARQFGYQCFRDFQEVRSG